MHPCWKVSQPTKEPKVNQTKEQEKLLQSMRVKVEEKEETFEWRENFDHGAL
jgi:hypothetical protein